MSHLTIDDVIDFVSLTEMNSQAVKLSIAVNGHIRKCDKCLQLVRAAQLIYDEFSSLNSGGDFRRYVFEAISTEDNKNENVVKIHEAFKEFDNFM